MIVKQLVKSLDRIGSIGALLAAVAAPCCFPLFAAVTAVGGLSGALGRYETVVLWVFQGFAVLTWAGLIFSCRTARTFGPVVLGTLALAALAFHFYWSFSFPVLYGALIGLLAATLWNYLEQKKETRPVFVSTITCPGCGGRSEETMPTTSCLFFYDCPSCQRRLKPLPGDCCVFCSYGSVPCPPIQEGEHCC